MVMSVSTGASMANAGQQPSAAVTRVAVRQRLGRGRRARVAAAVVTALAFLGTGSSRMAVQDGPAHRKSQVFVGFGGAHGRKSGPGAGGESRGARLARRVAESEAVEMWTAGPGEVYSGQAQKALYLLKSDMDQSRFHDSIDADLEALREQQEEEERQKNAIEAGDAEPGKDTLALRKRMEEVRGNERTRTVIELLYLKVCARFKQLKVPLIPQLKEGGNVKFGTLDLKGLTENMYSGDALELVQDHLFKIIGLQGSTSIMDTKAVVQIAMFQVGQVYAMSALFGYYLRRVDARYQLEKLAGNFGAWGETGAVDVATPSAEEQKSLKDYIESFGPEELQRMTSIASVEAQMAMEHQVAALFGDLRVLKEQLMTLMGRPNSQEEATSRLEELIQKNEVASLRITSDDLRRLVLEAVAYGALLNDEEKQVDTLYELTPAGGRASMGGPDGYEEGGRYLSE